MAIDDNTVYGLTGAQVKELPGKIEAMKGLARELTTADYDYPDANPASVALWRLPSGVYTAKGGVNTASSTTRTGNYGGMFFVSQLSANIGDNTLVLANFGGTGNQNTKLEYDYTYSDGTAWPNQSGISFIDSREVVDNLTSTRTDYVLSAAQGKALKDLIDAIVVPTKTSDLTNDSGFITNSVDNLTNYPTIASMNAALAGKADTSDIPTALSELTNDINAVSDANYVHTDNNYTTVEKTKLAGIAAGAEANVQADWAETDTTADSYIQNKPTIPTAVSQLTNDAGYTTNTGTITGVQANGTSVATSGVANIPSATTSRYGVTQLSSSVSSTSTTLAATPSAVRSAYNLANGKATITMSATDPGEGSALAANNFIAVYGDEPRTVLYNNASGAYSGITLTDSVNNYEYIDIYYKTNDGFQGYKRCLGGAAFNTDLAGWQVNSSTGSAFVKVSVFSFSGTSVGYISSTTSRHGEVSLSGGSVSISAADYIFITRVEGWNY